MWADRQSQGCMCFVWNAFIRYPATDPDLFSSSAQRYSSAWAEIAVRTLQNLPPVPYNGAQQIWNAAVRVGYPAEQLIAQYQPLLEQGLRTWPNFRVDFGSSNGLENAGVIDALSEMLMQSWRGYIELFPCWPSSKRGSFERLRARGAFIVSATFDPSIGTKRLAICNRLLGFSVFKVPIVCLRGCWPAGRNFERSWWEVRVADAMAEHSCCDSPNAKWAVCEGSFRGHRRCRGFIMADCERAQLRGDFEPPIHDLVCTLRPRLLAAAWDTSC